MKTICLLKYQIIVMISYWESGMIVKTYVRFGLILYKTLDLTNQRKVLTLSLKYFHIPNQNKILNVRPLLYYKHQTKFTI